MAAFLLYIGISPADLFAGFTGGMVAGLITVGPRPTMGSVFVSMLAGMAAAGYGGQILPPYVGLKPNGFWSFVIGLGGMPICRGAIVGVTAVVARFKFPYKSGDEDG